MLHYRRVVDAGRRQKRYGQNHEEKAHPNPRVGAILYILLRTPNDVKGLIYP
jgi:hypothetical protein